MSVAYVLLADVYKACGKPQAVQQLQRERKAKGLKKERGAVSVTVNGRAHVFHVGTVPSELRDSNPAIINKMEEWCSWLETQNVNVESIKCRHSEQLALAYAVLQGQKTVKLRKNLRVCELCHEASVRLTMKEGITIHHCDRTRVHVMANGYCSCGGKY